MSKPNADTCQENKIFLSHSYASREEFVREYEKLKYGKAKAKELYNLILNKLQKAVSVGNVESLKKFSKLIGYIKSIENQETLKNFHDDTYNHIENTNLVILACKHNKVEILKYVLDNSDILNNLSNDIKEDVVAPNAEDETCNNAFYYAIRSSNAELLDTLITKWPYNYFVSHLEELDNVISRAYESLKLKNVQLTDEMELFVENKLINLRFFSNGPEEIHDVENNLNNIKERIDLLLESISLLKEEYLNSKKVDERFLFIAKFIAQNIHILKNQLKSTYDRLPWEEVEFCLVSFVSSHIKQQDINLFFSAVLNKDKLLNHLTNFAKQLVNENVTWGTDISKLAALPKLKREEVVAEIISNNPQFEELYNVYRQIRDAYSLDKINSYIKLASLANSETKEGQLVITRSIQAIGEHLKNTLESPKLSSNTSELLLLTLSKDTKKIIIDLRKSLSHAYSLFKRKEIEECADANCFANVQKDIKILGTVVSDILHDKRLKVIRVLLEKISDIKDPDEIKETADILTSIRMCKMIFQTGITTQEHGKIEELISELNDKISDKTNTEKNLFKEINDVINCKKSRSVSFKSDYVLESMDFLFGNEIIDSEGIKAIRTFVDDILAKIKPKVGAESLKEIVKLVMKIYKSYMLREENKCINEIICKIFCIAEIDSSSIKWIEELNSKLDVDRGENKKKIQYNKLKGQNYGNLMEHRLYTLKGILRKNGLSDQLVEKFFFYKNNEKLQSAVKMLVLDIMSTLTCPGNYYLENNQLFLDDYTPLLTGKCLRNHLAHDNALVDVLLFDPSTAVLLNAKTLTTENITKKKIGKLVRDDPSKLKDRYNQGLVTITNQERMFIALEEGNLEGLKSCLKKGADIDARRSTDLWTSLHFAAKSSNLEAVKFILDHNLKIDVKDIHNQNPLHIAASFGSYEIVKFFAEDKNMDVNCLENQSRTPILMAAQNGHKNVLEILLKNNGDINIKDLNGFTPLHYAVKNNHRAIVEILIEKESNVDINKTKCGLTPLHIASINNHLDLVDFLLSNKANVNATGYNGWTPLHYIARSGNKSIANALVKKGADVNAKSTGQGYTPLHIAAQYGNREIIKLILNNDAHINVKSIKNRDTPLHLAAKEGYKDIVKTLLHEGADANAKNKDNYTSLHFAALRNDNKEVVEALIQDGANINVKSKKGDTPLHFAARGGYTGIVEVLVKIVFEINIKNGENKTPLELAVLHGHLQMVKLLLQHKTAKVMTKGNADFTVLHIAAQVGNVEIVKCLIKKYNDFSVKTSHGDTPLHLAAGSGHKEVIEILLDNGADVNSKSRDGFTPLHYAAERGYEEIIEVLMTKDLNIESKDDKSNVTPLYLSILNGNLDFVKTLLDKRANVNAKSSYNSTPLHAAALIGNKKIAETLIENKADVNVGDMDNNTPLHIAASNGHNNVVEVFLDKANIDIKNSKGGTPIELAVLSGHLQVVQTLLRYKRIDINAKDNNGYTLLHIASEVGKMEIVKHLIEREANVNVQTSQGNTPLHLAVANGYKDVIEILKAKGADISIKDNHNRTVEELELAVTYSNLYESDCFETVKTNSQGFKVKGLFKQLLTMQEKYHGPNHLKVAEVLISLGKIEINLGNNQKAKKFLERALNIQEKHGSENFEVTETLVNLASVYKKLGNFTKQKDLLEQALSMKEKHYGPGHSEVSTILINLGIAYGNLGNLEKKKGLLERALPILEQHYGTDNFEIVLVLINLGNACGALGDLQNQKILLEKALKIQKTIYSLDHFSIAITLNNLGGICLHLGDICDAKELLKQALTIKEKYYGIDDFELCSTLVNLSSVYKALGENQKAKQLLERALKIEGRHYGPNNFKLAGTLLNLGLVYGNLGYSKQKKELYEKALFISKGHYDSDTFQDATLLANLGTAYGDLGNNEKAKELLERAVSIQEKHGSNNSEVAATLVNLATSYNRLGKHKKEKKILERALAIQEKNGYDHFGIVRILMKLSIVNRNLGNLQKERKLIERALAIQLTHGNDNPTVVLILESLSVSCESLGDLQKGKEWLERALEMQEKHYGRDSIKVVRILEKLVVVYRKLGKNLKAEQLLERSVKIQERHYGYDPFEELVTLVALLGFFAILQIKINNL